MKYSYPSKDTTIFVLIDMQEKLVSAMDKSNVDAILAKQKIMLAAAMELKMPVIVTEQYPKGLGRTIQPLSDLIAQLNCPVFEKTSFSCFGSQEFARELENKAIKTIVISGIESHVCVQQTAIDAVEKGLHAVVLADTVASRHESDMRTALDLMRSAGVIIKSVESFIFSVLRDSSHPSFRNISKMLR